MVKLLRTPCPILPIGASGWALLDKNGDRVDGGNPRALGEIRKWDVERWVMQKVIGGIRSFARDLPIEVRGKAPEEISASLDKVDDIDWAEPSIWKPMLRHNIYSEIPREQWIGREFAFQIPAYHHALKAMARKRSWDISPEEVIREAMG